MHTFELPISGTTAFTVITENAATKKSNVNSGVKAFFNQVVKNGDAIYISVITLGEF